MNEKEDDGLGCARGLVNAFMILMLLSLIIGYGWWFV